MNKFKQKLSAYFRGRNFTSLVLVSIVICAVVFLNMILYMLTSAFGWYLYSPEELDLSITDSSDALFADAESGMEVTVPLFSAWLEKGHSIETVKEIYRKLYTGPLVFYKDGADEEGFLSSAAYSDRDSMEISVQGNSDRIILVARYDNLGKGASGAAVECLNIVLGEDKTKTLVI